MPAQDAFHSILSFIFILLMSKPVLFFLLIMSFLFLSAILLASQFVPVLNFCPFGQPKLECKPCDCHPEYHCETQCIQQKIMKECNIGVDSHNALASHHTEVNRTTRILLVVSLILNFFQTIVFLLRKPIRNCYQNRQKRQQQRQQAADSLQAERYTLALQRMLITPTESPQSHLATSPLTKTTSDEPLVSFLSNMKSIAPK